MGLKVITILCLSLAMLVALNVVLAQGEEETTELRIENPNPPPSGGSTVYYTFEIIDPDRTASPGDTVYFNVRITNLPNSTSALILNYSWAGWYLPDEYGAFYSTLECPTIPIGESYEGSFGHFVFTDAVPAGWVFTGEMGIGVIDGDPSFTKDAFSVTFPSISSCDQSGNDKNTFYPNEDVYAKGNGYPASTVVVIYIIPDGHDTTPDNAKTITSTTTDTEGTLTVTRVWRAPLDLGEYDIWVDVNIDGEYDQGDVWNYPALNVYLFLVTPEVPFGTITSMLTTVGAFAFFALFRKVK